jgi:hypothetical protein
MQSYGIEFRDIYDSTLWLKLLILRYADDTIILSDSPIDFQDWLDTLKEYCQTWRLKVNINKSKIIFGARISHNSTVTLD